MTPYIHGLQSGRNDTMHMLTVASTELLVSIFFDLQGALSPSVSQRNIFSILLQSVKQAFEVTCMSRLQELRAMSLDLGGLRDANQASPCQPTRCCPDS
jgi:hypothetical protein